MKISSFLLIMYICSIGLGILGIMNWWEFKENESSKAGLLAGLFSLYFGVTGILHEFEKEWLETLLALITGIFLIITGVYYFQYPFVWGVGMLFLISLLVRFVVRLLKGPTGDPILCQESELGSSDVEKT